MNLQGKSIYLRFCNNEDIPLLFDWRNNVDFRKNCSVRRDEINLENFKKELSEDFERDRHIQMMIVRRSDDKVMGTVYSYGYKKTDEYVFITTFLSEEYRVHGYGAEAVALFLFYLFSELPVFKIYMEVYEYNKDSFSCIRGAGFSQEGCFIGHRLFSGTRYNLLRYAIYRKKDLPIIERFLRRLRQNV